MSDFSAYASNAIARWLVGGDDMPAAHGNVYVSLHTGDPGTDGTSNEVTGSGYARQQTTAFDDWDITDNTFENSVDIQYGEANEDWGEVTHFVLWDGSSNTDNALAISPLDAARTISQGDQPLFKQGNLNGVVD